MISQAEACGCRYLWFPGGVWGPDEIRPPLTDHWELATVLKLTWRNTVRHPLRATLALGLAVPVLVGFLAALLPSWRAARLSIAEALRQVG